MPEAAFSGEQCGWGDAPPLRRCDGALVTTKDKSPQQRRGDFPQRHRGRAPTGLKRVLPRHVRACHYSASRSERWSIWSWRKDDPSRKVRTPYKCNSWRCPACARYEASVTFARIRDACTPLQASGFVFFVLTLDRRGYYSGEKWSDPTEAYRALGRNSERFLKRVRRWMGRQGMRPFKSEWVAVVEAHRSGWPHVNLMVYAPELADYLEREREARELAGFSKRGQVLLGPDPSDPTSSELLLHAVECGWGPHSTAERVRDRKAMAGYFTKLAAHADAHVGELAKLTQAPYNAPERFRRLRSGKGFLPPRNKNPDWTGALVKRECTPQGDWMVKSVNPPKDECGYIAAEAAAGLEWEIIFEEEKLLVSNAKRKKFGLPPRELPHVFVAIGDRLEPIDTS